METKKRKPNRLKHYDYSQRGVYFLTICTAEKIPILSSIESVKSHTTVGANCVRLSETGKVVQNEIIKLNSIYDNVSVDKYVIMPNHIHLMIALSENSEVTISRIVKQFKGSITKQLGVSIWQKSYYDHIIRDDIDYFTKWQYIDDNPAKWIDDELYYE